MSRIKKEIESKKYLVYILLIIANKKDRLNFKLKEWINPQKE